MGAHPETKSSHGAALSEVTGRAVIQGFRVYTAEVQSFTILNKTHKMIKPTY